MLETEAKGTQSEVPLLTLSHCVEMGDEPQTEPAEGTVISPAYPLHEPSPTLQLLQFPAQISKDAV